MKLIELKCEDISREEGRKYVERWSRGLVRYYSATFNLGKYNYKKGCAKDIAVRGLRFNEEVVGISCACNYLIEPGLNYNGLVAETRVIAVNPDLTGRGIGTTLLLDSFFDRKKFDPDWYLIRANQRMERIAERTFSIEGIVFQKREDSGEFWVPHERLV